MQTLDELFTRDSVRNSLDKSKKLIKSALRGPVTLDRLIRKAHIPEHTGQPRLDWFMVQNVNDDTYTELVERIIEKYEGVQALDANVITNILKLNKFVYYDFENNMDEMRLFTADRTMVSHVVESTFIMMAMLGEQVDPNLVYLSLLHDVPEDLPDRQEYKTKIREIRSSDEIFEVKREQIEEVMQEYDTHMETLFDDVIDYLQIPPSHTIDDRNLAVILREELVGVTRKVLEDYWTYIARNLNNNDSYVRNAVLKAKHPDRLHNTKTDFEFDFEQEVDSKEEVERLLLRRPHAKLKIHYRNWILLNESTGLLRENLNNLEYFYDMRVRLARDGYSDIETLKKRLGDDPTLPALMEKIQLLTGERIDPDQVRSKFDELEIQILQYDRNGKFERRTTKPSSVRRGLMYLQGDMSYLLDDMIGTLKGEVDSQKINRKRFFTGLNSEKSIIEFYAFLCGFQGLYNTILSQDYSGRFIEGRWKTMLDYETPNNSSLLGVF